MFVGILLNVLVSFSVGVVSFFSYRLSRHVQEASPLVPVRSFGLFWLAMSAVWLLIASMDFLSYIAGFSLQPYFALVPIVLAYSFQTFVGLSVVFIAPFINAVALGGRLQKIFFFSYWGLYVIFLGTLFVYGVKPWTRNFFARQITTQYETLAVFIVMLIPLWVLGARTFFFEILRMRKTSSPESRFVALGTASLLLIGITGFFDEAGLVYGWVVTAVRLGSLVAAGIAYVALLSLHDQKELVM